VSRTVLLVTASGVMGLCALGLYDPHLPGTVRYGLCLWFTGAGGMIPASLFDAAPRHAPSPSLLATTNGLMLQGGNLGSTLGPPTVAAVVAATGSWQGAPWLLVPVAACAGVFALLLGRLEGASTPGPV
jgi:nitrate/nitrite transporter NarK